MALRVGSCAEDEYHKIGQKSMLVGRVGNEYNTSLIRTYFSSVSSATFFIRKEKKEPRLWKKLHFPDSLSIPRCKRRICIKHRLALVWQNMHMHNLAHSILVGWVSCVGCRPSCCQIWTIPRERRHTSLHVRRGRVRNTKGGGFLKTYTHTRQSPPSPSQQWAQLPKVKTLNNIQKCWWKNPDIKHFGANRLSHFFPPSSYLTFFIKYLPLLASRDCACVRLTDIKSSTLKG